MASSSVSSLFPPSFSLLSGFDRSLLPAAPQNPFEQAPNLLAIRPVMALSGGVLRTPQGMGSRHFTTLKALRDESESLGNKHAKLEANAVEVTPTGLTKLPLDLGQTIFYFLKLNDIKAVGLLNKAHKGFVANSKAITIPREFAEHVESRLGNKRTADDQMWLQRIKNESDELRILPGYKKIVDARLSATGIDVSRKLFQEPRSYQGLTLFPIPTLSSQTPATSFELLQKLTELDNSFKYPDLSRYQAIAYNQRTTEDNMRLLNQEVDRYFDQSTMPFIFKQWREFLQSPAGKQVFAVKAPSMLAFLNNLEQLESSPDKRRALFLMQQLLFVLKMSDISVEQKQKVIFPIVDYNQRDYLVFLFSYAHEEIIYDPARYLADKLHAMRTERSINVYGMAYKAMKILNDPVIRNRMHEHLAEIPSYNPDLAKPVDYLTAIRLLIKLKIFTPLETQIIDFDAFERSSSASSSSSLQETRFQSAMPAFSSFQSPFPVSHEMRTTSLLPIPRGTSRLAYTKELDNFKESRS